MLKGRNNFTCLENGASCELGECQKHKDYICKYCEQAKRKNGLYYNQNIDLTEKHGKDIETVPPCPYCNQFYHGKNSQVTVYNYQMFRAVIGLYKQDWRNNFKEYCDGLDEELMEYPINLRQEIKNSKIAIYIKKNPKTPFTHVIYDEAHNLHSKIKDITTVIYPLKKLNYKKEDIENITSNEIVDILRTVIHENSSNIDHIINTITLLEEDAKINRKNNAKKIARQINIKKNIENENTNLTYIINKISQNPQNWIFDVQRNEQKKWDELVIVPKDTSQYGRDIFLEDFKHTIFTSATIPLKKKYIQELGLHIDEDNIVQLNKKFPPERMPLISYYETYDPWMSDKYFINNGISEDILLELLLDMIKKPIKYNDIKENTIRNTAIYMEKIAPQLKNKSKNIQKENIKNITQACKIIKCAVQKTIDIANKLSEVRIIGHVIKRINYYGFGYYLIKTLLKIPSIKNRILNPFNDNGDLIPINEIFSIFNKKENYNKILIHHNIKEGVDFKYELARGNIIYQRPTYGYTPRQKAIINKQGINSDKGKDMKDELLYSHYNDIIQMHGRSNRREDDLSVTYILDHHFDQLYNDLYGFDDQKFPLGRYNNSGDAILIEDDEEYFESIYNSNIKNVPIDRLYNAIMRDNYEHHIKNI